MKNLLVILSGDFWDGYPDMRGWTRYLRRGNDIVGGATTVWNFLYQILSYVWAFLFVFTVISVVIALVRMAISADDIPQKKAVAKHDLAASLVLLAIMGGIPFLFGVIIALLNMSL